MQFWVLRSVLSIKWCEGVAWQNLEVRLCALVTPLFLFLVVENDIWFMLLEALVICEAFLKRCSPSIPLNAPSLQHPIHRSSRLPLQWAFKWHSWNCGFTCIGDAVAKGVDWKDRSLPIHSSQPDSSCGVSELTLDLKYQLWQSWHLSNLKINI